MNNDVFLVMGSYLAIMAIMFFILNFLSQGFLFSFIRVKMSRGKFVLVLYKDLVQEKYAVGTLEESVLTFKYAGEKRKYSLPDGSVGRVMGVTRIYLDVVKNIVFTDSFKAGPAYDAEKMDSLYQRALTKPELTDRNEKILFVLILATLGAVALTWYTTKGVGDQIVVLQATVNSLKEMVAQSSTGLIP